MELGEDSQSSNKYRERTILIPAISMKHSQLKPRVPNIAYKADNKVNF
jgi:hypothetical protein